MKNVILIIVNMILAVLTCAIVMSVDARMVRSSELQSNLSCVVEETVGNLMQKNNYEISGYEQFVADLTENLSIILDTKSDITIKILKADTEKGILTVEVVEKFKHLNGNEGTVACSKTVIFNQLEEPEEIACSVKFYLTREDMENDADYYKALTVNAGDIICVPVAPEREEFSFSGWYDSSGNAVDFSKAIEADVQYYAKWN